MSETDDAEVSATPPTEKGVVRRAKAPSKYDLPSERYGMATHFAVLRRFLAATSNGTDPVAAVRVEGQGVPKQSAVLNAGFLTDIGLLVRTAPGMYKPTPAALELATAKSVGDDRARPVLNRIISNSWFADSARSSLAAKPTMTEKELLGDLSVVTQTDFSKKQGALAVILEYLVFAGIVVRNEDGSYSLGNGNSPSVPTGPSSTSTYPSPTGGPGPGVSAQSASPTPIDPAVWETVSTNDFFVRVRVSAEAIDDLKEHLKIVEKRIRRALEDSDPTR